MAVVSRRVDKLAKRLGLVNFTRESVSSALNRDALGVANLVYNALQRQIDQINAESKTNALAGYSAKVVHVANTTKVKLFKSGVDLSGDYEYAVYVEPSGAHNAFGINVFDILDAGRPALRERSKDESPYPLWGTPARGKPYKESNARISVGGSVRGPGGKFTIAKATSVKRAIIRPEPRKAAYDADVVKNLKFTHGPIAAVPAYFLYERARQAAKDEIAGAGFTLWDVIYVGPKPKK